MSNVLTIKKEIAPIPVKPTIIKSKVTFSFESDGEKGINLMGKGAKDTNKWYLLGFKPDGSVKKYEYIPKELGFNLNTSGQLIIEDEE